MIVVFLTCKDNEEADKISTVLLDKKLVACAKKSPIDSKFWWEGKKDSASEVMVMFETLEDKFTNITKEVKVLHGYKTPMLFSIPVLQTTNDVKKWLKEELE